MGLIKVQEQGRDENKKTTLLQKNCSKEGLVDYICCIVRQQN